MNTKTTYKENRDRKKLSEFN